jgi:pyrophosphatase PpaX
LLVYISWNQRRCNKAILASDGLDTGRSQMIEAVLFDLDGTLADTTPMIIECYRQVFKHYLGRAYSKAEIMAILSVAGRPERVIIRERVPKENVEKAVNLFRRLYAKRLKPEAGLYSGIIELLSKLSSSRRQVALVTGKSRWSTEYTLEEFRVKRYFRALITGEDVEEPKPSPQGVLMAVQALRSDSSRTVYVGDAPIDVEAGRAARVLTGAALWGATARDKLLRMKPDFAFETVQDLEKVVLMAQERSSG